MPVIAEYNAPTTEIRPSETGEVAIARAGTTIRAESRMTSEEYKQAFQEVGGELKKVGEVLDAHDALHEISTGAALAATNMNNISKGWDDLAKDPATAADPQAGQKYLEQVQPQWEKFQSGFLTPQGKRWAAEYVTRAQEHLGEKIAHDQSTLAGIHTANMVKTWGNQATLSIATDPSSLGFHMNEIGPTIDAMLKNSPMLSAEDTARVKDAMTRELKETFQKTAMNSIARLNPGRAEAMLRAGAFPDVNGAEATATIATERRVQASEARASRALAIQERLLKSQSAAQEIIGTITRTSDGTFAVPPGAFDAALHNKNLLPNESVTLFKFLEGAESASVRPPNEASTVSKLREYMFEHPDMPLDEQFFRAANENSISRQSALQLSQEYHIIHDDPAMQKAITSQQVQATMKEAQSVLVKNTGLGGFADPASQNNYSAFVNWFVPELKRQLELGGHLEDLLNRESPNYMLKGGKLQSFANVTDVVNANVNGLPTAGSTPAGVAAAEKHMNLDEK